MLALSHPPLSTIRDSEAKTLCKVLSWSADERSEDGGEQKGPAQGSSSKLKAQDSARIGIKTFLLLRKA